MDTDTSPARAIRPPGSRREELLATAADLFWAKGYGATPMSELARALGIQKASLYHHVRTKESLLYELSVGSMQHILDAATSVTEVEPLDHLREVVRRHIELLLDEQSRHATALTELRSLSPQERAHVTELRDRYDHVIDEAVRAAQVAHDLWPGVEPKLVRLGLLGMLNWSVFWYQPGGEVRPEQIADAFTSLLLGGR